MYVGLSIFNARARAINFSPDELPEVTLLAFGWLFNNALSLYTMRVRQAVVLSWHFIMSSVCAEDGLIDRNAQ